MAAEAVGAVASIAALPQPVGRRRVAEGAGVQNLTGCASAEPVHLRELIIDLLHKTVYAPATIAIADGLPKTRHSRYPENRPPKP
jgi:hypothetical protein